MKINKLLALFCSGIIAFSIPFSYASAEESEYDPWNDDYSYDEVEITDKDLITSEDGQYTYKTSTDEDGNKCAVLEEYLGKDTDVEIPAKIDGVKVSELGDRTFFMKTDIKSITIPESVEYFGYYPFYGCTSLTEFKVSDKNKIYKAENGILMGKDDLTIVAYPTGLNPESYTVPDTVQGISASAFAMCQRLKSITLPKELTFIGRYCFAECSALESIELPDGVTSLDQSTFAGCTALSDVKLPANLTTLGDSVFYQCRSLSEIQWPQYLSSIGQACFAATAMKSVDIPATITGIGYSAFGYDVDENDQFVKNSSFTIYGYDGSYAQTYALENELTFVAHEFSVSGDKEKDKDKGIKTWQIILIFAGAAVIAGTAIIVIIVAVKKKNKDKPAKNTAKSSEEIRQDLYDLLEETEENNVEESDENNEDT